MKWLHTMLVLTLAVLWLPVSVHCELEQISALNFLSCCPDESPAPHQDDDCETDGCAVVESGLYKTEESQSLLPALDLAPAVFLSSLLKSASAPDALAGFAIGSAPPDLPCSWQFSQRTALPVRAPSLAS